MRKTEDRLDMAGLAVGLGSMLLPSLLKAVGLGGGRGRGRVAAILGRGGVKGMKWGYRKCGRCGKARHRCAGRRARGHKKRRKGKKKRGRRGGRRKNKPLARHIRWN